MSKKMPRQTTENNVVVIFQNTSATAHILFRFLISPRSYTAKANKSTIYILMVLFDLPTSEIIWFIFKSGAQSFLLLTMLIRPTLAILLLLGGDLLKCFFLLVVVVVVGWCLKSTVLLILVTRHTYELSDQSDWIVSLAQFDLEGPCRDPLFLNGLQCGLLASSYTLRCSTANMHGEADTNIDILLCVAVKSCKSGRLGKITSPRPCCTVSTLLDWRWWQNLAFCVQVFLL